MSSELVLVVLEAVIILFLVFRLYGLLKKNKKIRLEKKQQEEYYQSLLKQNETLRSYMDNQHMVWNIEITPREIEANRLKVDMVVLMNGQELTEIWLGRYERGVQDGKVLREPEPVRPANNVTQLSFPFDDRRFDGDYRDFVNELTKLAVRFQDAEQLRSRLSSQVFNFRAYLRKRMAGERPKFPKESEHR